MFLKAGLLSSSTYFEYGFKFLMTCVLKLLIFNFIYCTLYKTKFSYLKSIQKQQHGETVDGENVRSH